MDQVQQYFQKRGIDVSVNTLGANQKLVNLFIKETKELVDSAPGKTSNTIKTACYKKWYNMEERTKFTGFEKFVALDKKCRQAMVQKTRGLVGENLVQQADIDVDGSYITELKKVFTEFKNPLLYLSGGIDSEFVALAMLEEKIQFTPIIFHWLNDAGKVLNLHDTLYALDFCAEHGLTPITESVNIEKLWNNPEFIELAAETNNSSPQINTYVYMVEVMAEKYKNSTHVLGGEVRYTRINESDSVANYIAAAKVSPAGYNGLTYYVLQSTNYTNLNTAAQSIVINYSWNGNYANNQTWTASGIVNGSTTVTPTNYPSGAVTTTGDWFTADTPGGTGWEYRTSYDGGGTYTAWTALAVSATNAVATITINGGGTSDVAVTNTSCVVQVRSTSSPGTVASTSFTARLEYDYVPTLETFTTAGSGSWTRPNANITTISAAVIGGGGAGGSAFRNSGTGGEFHGSAGGGGAASIRVTANSVAISGTAISYTVGSGGLTSSAAGGNSTITILGTPYTSTGGGGGVSSTSLLGGNGGSNGTYTGGNGGGGVGIEDSYGGGGAGAAGNGGNWDPGAGAGGASSTVNIVTLAGSSVSLTYGAGGAGGDSFDTGPGANGTAPGGGGGGGAVLVFMPGSGTAPGGDGGDGRVYIYY